MRNLTPAPARRPMPSFHTAPAVVGWVLTRPRSGPGWRAVTRQDYLAAAGTAPAGLGESPLPAATPLRVEGGRSSAAPAS